MVPLDPTWYTDLHIIWLFSDMLCTLKCRDRIISHEDALVQRPEEQNSVSCKEISSEFKLHLQ